MMNTYAGTKRRRLCQVTAPTGRSHRRSEMFTPNWNDLPDLCLLAIMEQLPLMDLLQVRGVNRRWKSRAQIVIKHIKVLRLGSYYEYEYSCRLKNDNSRERLDLLRFHDLQPNGFDFILGVAESLYKKWLKERKRKAVVHREPRPWERFLHLCRDKAITRLKATFPAITELVLFDCLMSEVEIIHLLYRWSDSLNSLKLISFNVDFDWPAVLFALNNLKALKHLSLFAVGGFDWRLKMPVLRQLSSFQLSYYDHFFSNTRTWMYRLFAQLDPDRLEHFALGHFSAHTHCSAFIRRNLSMLLSKHPAIAAKLTRLKIPKLSQTFLNFLCTRFAAINWLDIELSTLNDLRNLACLKQLKYLAIRSNQRPYSSSPLDCITERRLLKLPLFDSVRQVHILDFNIRPAILSFLFPNAAVERKARGDDNDVDYPGPLDEINFNKLNWRRINNDVTHRIDRVVHVNGLVPLPVQFY